ncbi:MAG: hypothetical protein HQM08_30850 [Candidatus Riflebacteria bacterium]|nr:hypothetical protein [Candidatus Riflebacteria bacterium]
MKIKASETLKKTIFEKLVLPAPLGPSQISPQTLGISFNDGDLFLAIHLADIKLAGSMCKTSAAEYNLNLKYLIVEDRYDFDFVTHGYIFRNTIPYLAANLAALDQISGAIVPYRWAANVGEFKLSQ